MRARLPTVLLVVGVAGLAAASLSGGAARADIYSYTDGEGLVHYTNIPPKGANKKKYRKLMDEKPERGSKAAAQRGACGGCDRVPARDRSKERLHRYDDYIYEASDLYKIPVPLIRAVIATESDYDPHVVSSAGAKGLMQLMPAAQSDMGVDDVFDPRENILGATRLLRINANRYDGDIVLTIAAYHAGPGSLKKYGNTVPPYAKTRQYLKMVLDRYYQYKAAETARP
jgi:soluble lytic murein transglycosylase-like protein